MYSGNKIGHSLVISLNAEFHFPKSYEPWASPVYLDQI